MSIPDFITQYGTEQQCREVVSTCVGQTGFDVQNAVVRNTVKLEVVIVFNVTAAIIKPHCFQAPSMSKLNCRSGSGF